MSILNRTAGGFSTTDVIYRTVDRMALSATIYCPAGPGPFPAIVDVHGGAWINGNRHKNKILCEYLAASGIIVMALDFRQEPHCYPASVMDVNAGIIWLKRHAAALGGRPDWVGGLGASSGGHLLLLNALMPLSPEYSGGPPDEGEHDARLRMAVVCWPIVDPHARYEMAKMRNLTKLITAHETYWDPPQRMLTGNPQRILDDRRFSDLPPALIIQGTNDANMTLDMIDRFYQSYREVGGLVDLRKYPGQPHDFIFANPASPATDSAIVAVRDFILSYKCEPNENSRGLFVAEREP
jgi:acetyl esterase